MSSSYMGHGAKYWAELYFKSQPRPPEDYPPSSGRSPYQAAIADLRTEVAYLRNKLEQHPEPEPDTYKGRTAQQWYQLYQQLKQQPEQQTLPDTYQGRTAQQWCDLYNDALCDQAALQNDLQDYRTKADLYHQSAQRLSSELTTAKDQITHLEQDLQALSRSPASLPSSTENPSSAEHSLPHWFEGFVFSLFPLAAVVAVFLFRNNSGALLVICATSLSLLPLSLRSGKFPGATFALRLFLVPAVLSFCALLVYPGYFTLPLFLTTLTVVLVLAFFPGLFYFIAFEPLFFFLYCLIFLPIEWVYLFFQFWGKRFAKLFRKHRILMTLASVALIASVSMPLLIISNSRSASVPHSASASRSTPAPAKRANRIPAAYVYVSDQGTKYHRDPDCSGMIDPDRIALENARSMGFAPCQKCY